VGGGGGVIMLIQRKLEFSAGWRTLCRPEAIIQVTVGQRLCWLPTQGHSHVIT